jgi:hypothetical protein
LTSAFKAGYKAQQGKPADSREDWVERARARVNASTGSADYQAARICKIEQAVLELQAALRTLQATVSTQGDDLASINARLADISAAKPASLSNELVVWPCRQLSSGRNYLMAGTCLLMHGGGLLNWVVS